MDVIRRNTRKVAVSLKRCRELSCAGCCHTCQIAVLSPQLRQLLLHNVGILVLRHDVLLAGGSLWIPR